MLNGSIFLQTQVHDELGNFFNAELVTSLQEIENRLNLMGLTIKKMESKND